MLFFSPSDDPDFDYMSESEYFTIYISSSAFSRTNTVKVQKDNAWIAFQTVSSLSIEEKTYSTAELRQHYSPSEDIKTDRNKENAIILTYPEVFKQSEKVIDIRYTLTGKRLQEDAIFNNPMGTPSLSQMLTLHNVTPKLEDGEVRFYKKGTAEVLWFMPKPYLYELGNPSAKNEDVTYQVVCTDPALNLSACTSIEITKVIGNSGSEWLTDPARQYPVALDPTIEASSLLLEGVILEGVILEEMPWQCGETLVDTRDDQEYATVLIGTQCWMAENLNVGTMISTRNSTNTANIYQTDNGTIEKYCYGYLRQGNASDMNTGTTNCATYGGLYQWNEAMQYSTDEGVQGICPNGWHIPTDAEWHTLELGLATGTCNPIRGDYGCDPAGTALKEGGSSGFNVKYAGYSRYDTGAFQDMGSYGHWWTAKYQDASTSFNREIWSAWTTIGRKVMNKGNSYPIRCIKDS
jgi:uncharacterized protein (TIGR02145 family)